MQGLFRKALLASFLSAVFIQPSFATPALSSTRTEMSVESIQHFGETSGSQNERFRTISYFEGKRKVKQEFYDMQTGQLRFVRDYSQPVYVPTIEEDEPVAPAKTAKNTTPKKETAKEPPLKKEALPNKKLTVETAKVQDKKAEDKSEKEVYRTISYHNEQGQKIREEYYDVASGEMRFARNFDPNLPLLNGAPEAKKAVANKVEENKSDKKAEKKVEKNAEKSASKTKKNEQVAKAKTEKSRKTHQEPEARPAQDNVVYSYKKNPTSNEPIIERRDFSQASQAPRPVAVERPEGRVNVQYSKPSEKQIPPRPVPQGNNPNHVEYRFSETNP